MQRDITPVRANRALKTHKYVSLVSEKLIHALKSPVSNVKYKKNGEMQKQERKKENM